nr:MAG: putative RNA-dependent RNA polymerase [Partitiviridae sp.]
MQDMNLIRYGKKPINRQGWRKIDRFKQRQQRELERVIKKAIHKHCDAATAKAAINGYHRSATDARSGENDFLKTDQPFTPVLRDLHYRRALHVTSKLFQPSRRLRPIAFPDLRYYPWTLNVSAEAPYLESNFWQEYVKQKEREGEIDNTRISFHNLYNEIFHENRIHVHSIKYGMAPFWDANGNPVPYEFNHLHSRSHLVKEDKPDKIRAVFGVPKLLLMVENMFIWNLQKEYLNDRVSKSPLLWGFETIRGGWQKLVNRLSSKPYSTLISADWSGFDHKALHEVIDDVHIMWRSWFDFDKGYEPSVSDTHDYSQSTTEEWKIQNLWDWMTNAIKHTPIKAESGNTYGWKFNGIASGFQQTQLLDSFVNCIMLLTCLSACGINIMSSSFQALFQGDDSVVAFNELLHIPTLLAQMSHEAKKRFNADLSPDKTTWGTSDNIEVLSYRNRSGLAYREPAELLAHLLYSERPRTPEATASACVGICQAAMGCSEQVYNACFDAFSFLVKEWKVVPEYPEDSHEPFKRPLYSFESKPLTVEDFPSRLKTFLQNFDTRTRTESDKQRLWPTKPSGNGFRFLAP